jgi:hypothetical protein
MFLARLFLCNIELDLCAKVEKIMWRDQMALFWTARDQNLAAK